MARKRTPKGKSKMGSAIAVAAFGALMTGVGATSSPAEASIAPEERTGALKSYRIPKTALMSALNTLADQNGLHLSYDASMTRGMKTRGLSGKYTVKDALRTVLDGTGLTYRLSPKGDAVSIVLAQNDTETKSDAPPVALPTIDVEGKDGGLGGRFTGYSPDLNKPAAASKSNSPLIQAPYSIQVVPREVIDDQQAISIMDAVVGNVSSVQVGLDNFYDGFIVRGFDVSNNTYRNSLRVPFLTNIETANVQSLEVLKGPAAMLYGRIEPGGLINIVTKQPLLVPYYSVQEQFGSWGLTRTTVDATGPLNDDKSLAYRVNLAYQNTDSFRNFVTRESFFIAPTISYQPIEQFRLNIEGQYQNLKFVADTDDALVAIGTTPANIPISRYLQDPTVTSRFPSRQQQSFIGYNWTYDIANNWNLTNRFAYSRSDYVQRITNFRSICLVPGTADCTLNGDPLEFGTLKRALWNVDMTFNTLAANLDLKGLVFTGPIKHDILAGTDFFRLAANRHGYQGLTAPIAPYGVDVTPINIFNPTYTGTGLANYTSALDNFNNATSEQWKGVYAQDMMSFADDRLHFLIGGRYDWAENANQNNITKVYLDNRDQAFSPRLGAVVQPLPWLSFYGNYSRSFGVTNSLFIAPGQPLFSPQKGTQWEGGAKAEFLDGRLTATMAYYDIIKSNVLVPVPGSNFSMPVGLVESKGVEFDVAGRINENWSVIGSYSHDDARITRDSTASGGSGNTGNRLASVPLNAANLWVKYDAEGPFTGLSLGGGFNFVGSRLGDNANTFVLPAYTVVNAMIMYRFQPSFAPWLKNLTAQLNVRNLLDTTYYTNSFDRFSIYPGAPRTFLASVRAEF
jgi:iron complex outermembrane receptor protein